MRNNAKKIFFDFFFFFSVLALFHIPFYRIKITNLCLEVIKNWICDWRHALLLNCVSIKRERHSRIQLYLSKWKLKWQVISDPHLSVENIDVFKIDWLQNLILCYLSNEICNFYVLRTWCLIWYVHGCWSNWHQSLYVK